MRRSALLAVGCALSLLFIGAAPAAADNGPHIKGAGLVTDSCASCHRTHTAQAPYLLKQSQPGLCYTCHGGTATGANTDVQNGVGYSGSYRSGGKAPGGLRGGGFQYALIDSGNPSRTGDTATIPVLSTGEAVTSTHSIDSSSKPAWGFGPISATANWGTNIPLRCGSCHDPHGNGNYRILRAPPKTMEGPGMDEWGKPAISPAITIPDVATKVYTTVNYWDAQDVNDPNDLTTGPAGGFIANIADWCSGCHTRYLAGKGAGRTDSGDALFKIRHRSNFPVSGTLDPSHPQTNKPYPNCAKCHVAHGSNASQGAYSSSINWPDGTPSGDDSKLLRADNRGVCQICHQK